MRIIAGDFKGRRLSMPIGNDIRPTTEKVKEAIFSIIQNDLDGAVCCDLFAGTGNLGLEALSRGASFCYFSDNSRDAIKLLKSNIDMCRAGEMSRVIPGSFEKALQNIAKDGKKVNIFFLDPPYREGLYERCFELIAELELMSPHGIIVCEHARELAMPESFGEIFKQKDRNYGTITVSIYSK